MGARDYAEMLLVMDKREKLRRKTDLVLRVYTVLGLVIAAFAAAYFVLATFRLPLTNSQTFALTAAGVGIALAAFSRVMVLYRSDKVDFQLRRENDLQAVASFLADWVRFEAAAKRALDNEREEYNRHSISEVIARLYAHKKIDAADMNFLERAIQLRNLIVHGAQIVPREVARDFSKRVAQILAKIGEPINTPSYQTA